MEVKTYPIEGVALISPAVYGDSRGWFMESYNRKTFEEKGIPWNYVQDNQSFSVKGVLRGLHYQVNRVQGKLARALEGEIYDVAVDIRPNSPTFGQWVAEILSAENKRQLYVPEGFAHGFQVISDQAQVFYKCTDFYSPKDERGIMWNDPDLNIQWPGKDAPLLSEKDLKNTSFKNLRLD